MSARAASRTCGVVSCTGYGAGGHKYCSTHQYRYQAYGDPEYPVKKLEKHGMWNSPEHRAWNNMRTRCYNVNRRSYKNYGARGITVCDEWNSSFLAFYRDMGDRPSAEHSIERIDNEKGYFPENCRWANRIEQANNKTSNVMVTWNGETYTAVQLARLLGKESRIRLIRERLKNGWSTDRAFSEHPHVGDWSGSDA